MTGVLSTIFIWVITTIITWLIFDFCWDKIKKWISAKITKFRIDAYKSDSSKVESAHYTTIIENSQINNSFFSVNDCKKYFTLGDDAQNEPSTEELVKELTELYSFNFNVVEGEDPLEIVDLKNLNNAHKCVLDEFKNALAGGKVRYNKDLYGVLGVSLIDNECRIKVYNSDYYTFKVTAKGVYLNSLETDLLSRLKENKQNLKQNLIEGLFPYLNSIGIGGFIIINRGNGDELVWSRRNKNCQSGGYWHFSFDETFTNDDNPEEGVNPINYCIKRGLAEELGILTEVDWPRCSNDEYIKVIEAGVIHTGIEDGRFEFELLSAVRLCFSDSYTIDDFILGYKFAKDAEIESEILRFVPISNIETFVKQEKCSPESIVLAKKIALMSKYKLIGSDFDLYRKIIAPRN